MRSSLLEAMRLNASLPSQSNYRNGKKIKTRRETGREGTVTARQFSVLVLRSSFEPAMANGEPRTANGE